MYQRIVDQLENEMTDIVSQFDDQLKNIHAGRASTAFVEGIKVSSYGTNLPLKQIATISVPEPNVILISPWDISQKESVITAIKASDIDVNSNDDGKNIRLVFPPMNDERRGELKKIVKTKSEEARVVLRNLRENSWKQIQKMEKEKAITEDDKYEAEKNLNKQIAKFNEDIEAISEKKNNQLDNI